MELEFPFMIACGGILHSVYGSEKLQNYATRRLQNPRQHSFFSFCFLCRFISMVLETVSQSVIPVILQKFIFKKNNESADSFPVQGDSEIKSVDVEGIEETSSKVERKRFKKRRRREKRKLKESPDDVEHPQNVDQNHPDDDAIESEEEFLDLNSAFVTLAVSRKKIHNPSLVVASMQSGTKDKATKILDEKAASERLAIQGCKLADKQHYEHSIDRFTKAIELTPCDYRFYGNRSFCYNQLGDYKRALKDANKAIALAPDNPKGYFRKGEALRALKKLQGSKNAFQHVLKLDEDCEDARLELENVQRLLEISSKENNNQYVNYQDGNQSHAVALTSGGLSSHGDVTHYSKVDYKMDPTNPDGFSSLWIGNISAAVTEQQLFSMFSEYGLVSSVRILPKKFCAFVNFQESSSAGLAMKQLQRTMLCGERILIRFPDNPSLTLRKTSPASSIASSPSLMQDSFNKAKAYNDPKQSFLF